MQKQVEEPELRMTEASPGTFEIPALGDSQILIDTDPCFEHVPETEAAGQIPRHRCTLEQFAGETWIHRDPFSRQVHVTEGYVCRG